MCCRWRLRRAANLIPLIGLVSCGILHYWVSASLLVTAEVPGALQSPVAAGPLREDGPPPGPRQLAAVVADAHNKSAVHLDSARTKRVTEAEVTAVTSTLRQRQSSVPSSDRSPQPPVTAGLVASDAPVAHVADSSTGEAVAAKDVVLQGEMSRSLAVAGSAETAFTTSLPKLSMEATTRVPRPHWQEAVMQYTGELPPPPKSSAARSLPPEVTDRYWGPERRCAFISLLIARQDVTKYAAFVEAASRVRIAFKFEREYPHIVFHEGNLPPDHQRYLKEHLPLVQFHNISAFWKKPPWVPPKESWLAKDRSEGYRTMCRFFGVQLFAVMAKLDYDAFMRVDDDVFMLFSADYDPFRRLFESGLVYMYGTFQEEKHTETPLTMLPWLAGYCDTFTWENRNCTAMAESVMWDMFFNNLFMTRLSYWMQPDVIRFLYDVDHTSNIYINRWGDAPIQTAAVRLFTQQLDLRFPQLIYVHNSGQNLVFPGGLTNCLDCPEASRVLNLVRRMLAAGPVLAGHRARVAEAQRDTWKQDLINTRISPANWSVEAIRNLDDNVLFKIVTELGVWCDGADRIADVWLMPRVCCCHLDTYRSTPEELAEVNKKVLTTVVRNAGLQVLSLPANQPRSPAAPVGSRASSFRQQSGMSASPRATPPPRKPRLDLQQGVPALARGLSGIKQSAFAPSANLNAIKDVMGVLSPPKSG